MEIGHTLSNPRGFSRNSVVWLGGFGHKCRQGGGTTWSQSFYVGSLAVFTQKLSLIENLANLHNGSVGERFMISRFLKPILTVTPEKLPRNCKAASSAEDIVRLGR